MAAEKEKEKAKAGGDRWKAAIVNLSEMSANLDSLQKILAKKAVFVDDDTFSKASLIAEQARNIKVTLLLFPSTWCNFFYFWKTVHPTTDADF